MAPELLAGEAPSVRSDIYAFDKVLKGLLPDNRLAVACLDPDPERRPQSVEHVLRVLRGGPSRRNLLIGTLLGAAGTALCVYEHSRPAFRWASDNE